MNGILFLNQKGEVLLSRMYRDGVTRQVAETFRNQASAARALYCGCSTDGARASASQRAHAGDLRALALQVIVQKEAGRCPVQMFGTSSFMYVKVGTVFIVAVSQGNAQAAVAFQFLSSLVKIIKAYCGPNVNDDLIRNNFVLLYEVLDEVLDYGFPQNTTIDLLKAFITQQAETTSGDMVEMPPTANITIQATGAISWRKEGIKYRKNELFIDVVEQCNLMVSNKGTVLRNDVVGSIMVKCYLSGMPECKFGLNDKLLLDNEAKNNRSKVRNAPALLQRACRSEQRSVAALGCQGAYGQWAHTGSTGRVASCTGAARASPPYASPLTLRVRAPWNSCPPPGLRSPPCAVDGAAGAQDRRGHRDRRLLLPPVRQAGQVRPGPHGLLRAAGRRVPADELPHHRVDQPALPCAACRDRAWAHAHRDQRQGRTAQQPSQQLPEQAGMARPVGVAGRAHPARPTGHSSRSARAHASLPRCRRRAR